MLITGWGDQSWKVPDRVGHALRSWRLLNSVEINRTQKKKKKKKNPGKFSTDPQYGIQALNDRPINNFSAAVVLDREIT